MSAADEERQPGEDLVTLTVGRARVGMVGLGAIFERLKAEGRAPTEMSSGDGVEELVELAAKRNYIPDAARAEYANALLAQYRRFIGEDMPEEEPSTLSIKVLGMGCPRCERLMQEVMNALGELGIAADVEHVTNPARIGEYGVLGTPALIVNGRVEAAGTTPSATDLRRLLGRR